MTRVRRIALLIGQDIAFCRRVLQGVHDYAITRGWMFHDVPADRRVLGPMRRWKPDGIICSLFDEEVACCLARCRVPVVNTSSMVAGWKGPLVDVDHLEVGRLAAEHLLDRGFRHFGFLGSPTAGCSTGRATGFARRLAQAGFTPSICHAEYRPVPLLDVSWQGLDRSVRNWLLHLPKPVGVLASHDKPARDLAETCHQLGIRVPDEVAVLGVDDDEFECQLCHPPLSSVRNPGVQIGYEAARLLDRLVSGESPAQLRISIPPTHVVARQSTETTAVDDPDVAAALTWIRDHLSESIAVDEVVDAIGTCRRTLERRFRATVGDSILEKIRLLRIEKAKRLLAETDMKLSVIAQQCGLTSAARLTVVFRQVTGIQPSVFRRAATDRAPVRTESPVLRSA